MLTPCASGKTAPACNSRGIGINAGSEAFSPAAAEGAVPCARQALCSKPNPPASATHAKRTGNKDTTQDLHQTNESGTDELRLTGNASLN